MKEIQSILEAYAEIDFSRTTAALATVVRVEGSSYRRTGARMLVLDNGQYLGGISGGCLEGDALRRAQKAIVADKASVVTYDTTKEDEHQVGVGLGCNGIIDVLFTPIKINEAINPVTVLSTLPATRVPRVVVSIIGSADGNILGSVVLFEDEQQFRTSFPIPGISDALIKAIRKSLDAGVSLTVFFEEVAARIFIEVILPVTHLVIYGGNYDIYPLARLTRELGWKVTVVTNIGKADKSLFGMVTDVIHNKSEVQPATDAYSAIMLMAHDYKTDLRNYKLALASEASYIGLLGPKKRAAKIYEELSAEGNPVSDKDRSRTFAPAGLDIGANMPEEIALSILAEIISNFTGRSGISLRLRERNIHED